MKTFSTEPRSERLRPVPCALCGSESFALRWDCGSFAFVRCRECSLVQQNPQSEPSEVASRYGESYLEYEAANQFAYRDLELLALADLGIAGPAESSPQAKDARRALDIGCATGALLDALRGKGWEPQGVEICAPAAEYGRRRFGLPIHTGTLESASFPSASFGLVHASHLIEHLNDPFAFLLEARRLLAPGGRLVLTTPNADGFQPRALGPAWRSAIFDHLYLFSLATLASLLAKAGFTIERSVTWGGWAKGQRPAFAKPVLDRLAKILGAGDVCAVSARHLGAPRFRT
ncbi:MAG: class I SAM-dependent methyltransferase [Spirochaetaceae bacterium]|nr:class I SAM-dependent methyltransferase [Spirochaetaceae bacterium]